MFQYADDTFLISDGSPLTLDGILRELNFIENTSGLKINFHKKTQQKWYEQVEKKIIEIFFLSYPMEARLEQHNI